MKLYPTCLFGIALACSTITASANTISLVGNLDPNNAGDAFVYEFTASAGVTIGIQSYGYGGSSATSTGFNAAGAPIASGGFDTYLSLFSGIGPSATFLSSNDDGPCPPAATDGGNCFDSRLVALSLPAGKYTLVLTESGNISFAENYGTGTLGDGFTGLEQPGYYDPGTATFRTSNYALDLRAVEGTFTPISGAPEPAGYTLGLAGILLIAGRKIWQVQMKSNGGTNV
jgi:hypothetical protein